METLIESVVLSHRFGPVIFENTTKLIIGTLPPDSAPYYYSNSRNTRFWDILKTISEKSDNICNGSYLLSTKDKNQVLKSLNLGLCDILKKYARLNPDSVDDNHIIPVEYFNLPEIIKETKIDTLLFVYQSAAKWFLHSLESDKPSHLHKVNNYMVKYGQFYSFLSGDKLVRCILLPNPLNRGRIGETIEMKLSDYRSAIFQ
jgi:G:T/U-mismatch repair DNA glycosylase